MSQSNDLDYANLHTKSEEDLIGLGLGKFKKGLFLFPESFFNDIPEGIWIFSLWCKYIRFRT